METCHNRKRELPVVPTTIVKSITPIASTKTQLVKLQKIHVCYPCVIYYSAEHRYGECLKKIKVHNMFRTKPINFTIMTTPKSLRTNNVPVNVVFVVTIHSQQSKQ